MRVIRPASGRARRGYDAAGRSTGVRACRRTGRAGRRQHGGGLDRAAHQRVARPGCPEADRQRAAQQHHLRGLQIHPLDDFVHPAGQRQRLRQGRPVLHRGDQQREGPLGRAGAPPRHDNPEGAHLFDPVHGPRHKTHPDEDQGRDVRAALQGVLDRHDRSRRPARRPSSARSRCWKRTTRPPSWRSTSAGR